MQKDILATVQHVILIRSNEHQTYVAQIVSDITGKTNFRLVDFYAENISHPSLVGNIYKAKVTTVHNGLGACFVRIGADQSAFLYDKVPSNSSLPENPFHKGQELMVQVCRDSLGGKHSVVTTRISLPGRFLVYLPTLSNYIGLSRQINDVDNREKIKEQIRMWCSEQSVIVRTKGADSKPETLQKELDQLQRTWAGIQKKFIEQKTVGLVWSDVRLPVQILRDTLTKADHTLILVDDTQIVSALKDFAACCMPEFKNHIQYYSEPQDLFEKYSIKKIISDLLEKKVWLKSGGFITIEETEASVVVDVNTGRSRSQKNVENYILKTNLEAASELARQLCLRNCGGIIIIDFIDMKEDESRRKVMETLMNGLKKDRAYTQVFPMSELGVVQMTRKRRQPSLRQILCQPCPDCQGSGIVKNYIL